MLAAKGGPVAATALVPQTSTVSAACLPRRPRRLNSQARSSGGGRHTRGERQGPAACHAAPQHQQWRTQSSTARPPPGRLGAADGPPALAWAAGGSLLLLVVFNLLRSLVLTWVNNQPRSVPRVRPAPGSSPAQPAGAQGEPTRPRVSSVVAAAAAATASVEEAARRRDAEASAGQWSSGEGVGGDAVTEQAVEVAAAAATGVGPRSGSDATTSEEAGTVQIANYQLPQRGSQPSNNLGRVVFCASLAPSPSPSSDTGPASEASISAPGSAPAPSAAAASPASTSAPWHSLEWHQLFWRPLLSKYSGGPSDRVTGLLVHYGDCVLHVLEGDNNQLFALLRELRPEDVGVHGLEQIRVPCYILDLRERLFEDWHCAAVRPPTRRRLSRASMAAAVAAATGSDSSGRAAAAAVASKLAGGTRVMDASSLFPDAPEGMRLDEAAEPEGAAPEKQLATRIQQLELFVKFVGPKLSALATQSARDDALRSLVEYETTTPPRVVVSSLASDALAPALPNFVATFDADYRRYISLLAMAESRRAEAEAEGDSGPEQLARLGSGGLLRDLRQLAPYYDDHVRRDLAEAMADRAEERRDGNSDEVARRLARGMRLKVQQ